MSPTPTLSRGPTLGLLKGFALDAGRTEIEVVMPCRDAPLPGFGEILLIETAPDAAMVGRVCRYQAAGRLIGDAGDAYLADLSRGQDRPPSSVVTRLLRYTLKLQLLGYLRRTGGRFAYAAGERALAPFGSPVREPSDAALEYLCNVGLEDDPSAAPLGELAYGDTVRSSVTVRFSVARLKGRRSFVFARAGYGKSNLVKHLIAQLYRSPPDVGLLIFDPEGEYALPDADGRPGLVNVPELADRIALYTARRCDPAFRGIVRGPPTLDFGDFLPQDIIANFVPPEKHEMVFANLLRSMDLKAWKDLVACLDAEGFKADDRRVADLIGYRPQSGRQNQADVSVSAIKNNLVPHLRRLHQKDAPIGRELIQNLREARIVIVDTSLLGGDDARAVTGMLLWRVFAHNQRHFTDVAAPGVRCLAVLEEAQSFLSERDMDDRSIFVRWVKEGRKYNLGALLVTQQPGAIADQIISQGDNFFAMHLLNERDLATLQRHNAHYSDDILGVIRGEPIRGNCYFWSAPDQPFVLPVRVRNFADSARPGAAPPTRPAAPPAEPGDVDAALRKAVAAALNEDPRVWLYAVEGETEGEQAGVVVSRDYLLNAVGERFRSGALPAPAGDVDRWLSETMPGLVSGLLRKKGGAEGFALLAGHKRPVWRLPRARLRLAPAKKRLREAVAFAAN